jgi:hypothetical protein
MRPGAPILNQHGAPLRASLMDPCGVSVVAIHPPHKRAVRGPRLTFLSSVCSHRRAPTSLDRIASRFPTRWSEPPVCAGNPPPRAVCLDTTTMGPKVRRRWWPPGALLEEVCAHRRQAYRTFCSDFPSSAGRALCLRLVRPDTVDNNEGGAGDDAATAAVAAVDSDGVGVPLQLERVRSGLPWAKKHAPQEQGLAVRWSSLCYGVTPA